MDPSCLSLCVTAALLLLQNFPIVSSPGNISNDQSALLAFKSHLSLSPDNILSTNWSVATPVCSWIGVRCGSRHHRVTALNVSNLQLSGTISPHLGNLTFLASLNMSCNKLYGSIPEEFGNLRRLQYLNLRRNDLAGPLPIFLGSLSRLRILALLENDFSGAIPSILANSSRLQYLSLAYNNLEGNIPQEYGDLQHLRLLDLQYNMLRGPMPPAIFNVSSLQTVSLAANNLTGALPADIGHRLPNLQGLYLGRNSIEGSIPKDIGNLTMLTVLGLHENNLEGEIPEEIGNLQNLQGLSLSENHLTGPIPAAFFNISTLQRISCTQNLLSGSIPSSLGRRLNLQNIYFSRNNFSGVILESLSNASQLIEVDLGENIFTGHIPYSLGNLTKLTLLRLISNNFYNSPSSELSFLTSLTKCRHLRVLDIGDNPLGGFLPSSIGNFSTSLNEFLAYSCKLKGNIPKEIGRLSNLTILSLFENELTGSIPSTIQYVKSLQAFDINTNNITGVVPDGFCNLKSLGILTLYGNDLYSPLPDCLGNITSLRYLHLDHNRLSDLPKSLWNLHDLLALNTSSNQLSGILPQEIGNLHAAIYIDLSSNSFSGSIPDTIGGLQNLIGLSFANNNMEGPIPGSFGQMLSLETLDLSNNKLNGEIPKSLEHLTQLKLFNVSFNKLSGVIPEEGPFANFTSQSFMSNTALCGAAQFRVPLCNSHSKARMKRIHVIIASICGVVGVIFLGLVLGFLFMSRQRKRKVPTQSNSLAIWEDKRISYYELERATNGFSESNLLGIGSFGSVYMGVFGDGTLVAVKVFNTQLEGVAKSFDTECEALRSLRHRNLTRVITSCCVNDDFKSLVLAYMPNGSLEKWLYSHNYFLNMIQRLDIMIDIAHAINYLHSDNEVPLVHCDLKPNNVLLDDNMVGHVCDFGIAKLLGGENSIAYTTTLATIGYIAPEYGQNGLVSTKCDIYSFGIMLMETFTRVKPSDDMFVEPMTLRSWVSDSTPSSIIHVIDANLIEQSEDHFDGKVQCLTSIMELALHCTEALPEERLDANQVLAKLEKIRKQFFISTHGHYSIRSTPPSVCLS